MICQRANRSQHGSGQETFETGYFYLRLDRLWAYKENRKRTWGQLCDCVTICNCVCLLREKSKKPKNAEQLEMKTIISVYIMSYSLQGARMTSSGRDMRSTMAIFTCCKILCRSVTDLGEMDADGKSIFTEKMSRACFVLFFFFTSLQGNGCRPLVLISSSLHVRHANWLCIKKKRKNVWPRVAFLTNF